MRTLSNKLHCFLIWGFLLTVCHLTTFKEFKTEMEVKVEWIARNMSLLFNQRCLPKVINCQEKSINLCTGTGARQCLTNFPTPDKCATPGILFSLESGIRLPNTVNLNSLTVRERQFICSSAYLSQTFMTINQQNGNRHSYAYLGSSTGAFRVLPSFMEEQVDGRCYDYDPRRRPWYVSTIAGGKNIIILLDISGSMDGERITNAKKAVKTIIDTMSVHDFVGFIVFNTVASVLGGYQVVQRASSDVKSKLEQQIDNISVKNQTNYQAALEKAFELLLNSSRSQQLSPCSETVFLFMTDGTPSEGHQTSELLKGLINEKLNEITNMKLTFMSYIFGINIDHSLLQSLSCEYNGIVFEIEDSQNMLNRLSNYYTYLGEGANTNNAIWSDPYEDAFGLGQILTVSFPVYYVNNNGIRTILGVAGIDILMSQMLSYQYDKNQVLDEIRKDKACFESLEQCKLQSLRKSEGDSWICGKNCSNLTENQLDSCNQAITTSIFEQALDTREDEDKCCGLTHQQMRLALGLGIGLGLFVLIAIVVIAYYCCCKGMKKGKKDPEKKKKIQKFVSLSEFNLKKDYLDEEENEEEMYREAKEKGIKVYEYRQFPQCD